MVPFMSRATHAVSLSLHFFRLPSLRTGLVWLLLLSGFWTLRAQTAYLPHLRQGTLVEHQFYCLSYVEAHEQPEWVHYRLTASMAAGQEPRSDRFRPDPQVRTGSAALEDYVGSGYDRGHLAPAADMAFDAVAMSESFYLSNMSPQAPSLNRGGWRVLEGLVRDWAREYGELYVTVGPLFSEPLGRIGPNEVTVPSAYYKAVYCPAYRQMVAFIVPNARLDRPVLSYMRTVDEVERLTGLDLYVSLPDSLEEALESTLSPLFWPAQPSARTEPVRQSPQVPARIHPPAVDRPGSSGQGSQTGRSSATPARPASTSVQCRGTTLEGQRCKRKTKDPSGYCYQHRPQLP